MTLGEMYGSSMPRGEDDGAYTPEWVLYHPNAWRWFPESRGERERALEAMRRSAERWGEESPCVIVRDGHAAWRNGHGGFQNLSILRSVAAIELDHRLNYTEYVRNMRRECAEFARLGEAIFGDNWYQPFANMLGIEKRDALRWAAGVGYPPPYLFGHPSLLAEMSARGITTEMMDKKALAEHFNRS